MKLLYDDYNEVYVWVDDKNEDDELSPRFDSEEGAEHWYWRIQEIFKK